ncbi:MAG: hypothetical protein M3036_10750, partial [Bifidobacteriales bacterium]|nr:hypothetical protein [Bifidobacteriales bacterium]
MAADGMLDEAWPERVIEVLNKADLLGGTASIPVREGSVAVSALTGEGLPDLMEAIDAFMTRSMKRFSVSIPVTEGAALAWLYEHGEVTERHDGEERLTLMVRLFPADQQRFVRHYPHLTLQPEG